MSTTPFNQTAVVSISVALIAYFQAVPDSAQSWDQHGYTGFMVPDNNDAFKSTSNQVSFPDEVAAITAVSYDADPDPLLALLSKWDEDYDSISDEDEREFRQSLNAWRSEGQKLYPDEDDFS